MLLTRLVSAFLAALCLCAVAASGASANSNEIVNKEGKALVKKGFTGALGGEPVVETIHGQKMSCKGGSTKGTVTSKTTIEASLTLTGCSSGGMSCQTAGSKEGEVAIGEAPLVLLKAHEEDVMSEAAKASVACGPAEVGIKGTFLIPVGSSQENHLKTEYKFTAAQKEGIQIPAEYENTKLEKIKVTLEASFGETFVQAGIAATLTIKLEEEAKFI